MVGQLFVDNNLINGLFIVVDMWYSRLCLLFEMYSYCMGSTVMDDL